MLEKVSILLIVIAVFDSNDVESSRILCIFPTPSISHQVVFRSLTLALHQRGHEIVVLTPNPINDPDLKNYTEIDLSFLYSTALGLNYIEMRKTIDWLSIVSKYCEKMSTFVRRIMNLPEFQKIYQPTNGERFDLVVIQVLFWHAFYPLAKHFDAPWIGIISSAPGLMPQYSVGNPIMPSHPSNWELDHKNTGDPSFWQRLKNYAVAWRFLYYFRTDFIDQQEKLAREYFGDYGSTIDEIEKNVSLIFVNRQLPITFVTPDSPKFIEIGGLRVLNETNTLPQELRQFLDGAAEGFVYVSFGSNAKSSMMSEKLLAKFTTAFAELPYKILWKFETDTLPGKPNNVLTMKWIPQSTVLAHPNLKVFVYQGGLQSTEEAVHHAVPLIGFPIMADQDSQVHKMVSLGVCKKLEIHDFSASELVDAVMTVATNISYKQNMLNLRSLVNDKPYDPLENAVWWTEHVIRHRGISYLYSSTTDLPWYQRSDVDLVVFITISVSMSSIIIMSILYRLCVRFFCLRSIRNKEKLN